MITYHLASTMDGEGWCFTLSRKRSLPFAKKATLALPHWPDAAQSHPGVAFLLSLLATEEARGDGEAVFLTHARIAALSRTEAARIELPSAAPFTLFLSHDAPIGDVGFRLRIEWFQRNGVAVFGWRREETALVVGAKRFLLLDPLYSALKAIDTVNSVSGDPSPAGLDRRMAAYAQFKEYLIRLTGDVRADEYLRGLTIHHATAIGIDLEPGDESAPFLPTLYGDRPSTAGEAEPEEQSLDPSPGQERSREPLLPKHHAGRFEQRFLSQGARSHYVLGTGIYTVLDAPVAAVLQVLERVNRADTATRQAFRHDPMAFLTPAIEEVGGDGGIVCELRGYGPRVIGVGPWVPPSLSFPLAVSRDWFPAEDAEVFSIIIPGEAPLVVRVEEIGPLKEQVGQALASGEAACMFNGRSLTLNPELVQTIQGLAGRITVEPPTKPVSGETATDRWAALTKDNEEQLTFLAKRRSQQGNFTPGIPQTLRSAPMPHQKLGIAWLQAGYLAGAPGLLLADDMGLGKTYQILAFLSWLREQTSPIRRLGPILIVAPKTLLGNWRDELNQHLAASTLGQELHAYERGLRDIKLHAGGGNDTTLHRQTLDVDSIAAADLVLTTYETLRDYHLSFGKARFAVIVYDEVQKLKNPTSLMNRGAKAQQGDFTLLLTGTPIENSVQDLWTLLDIAWPGFLGLSAREFLNRYRSDDARLREELKRRLIEPTILPDQIRSVPPIMLRRFKQDILEGLPERHIEATQDLMPPEQQAAYDAVRATIHDRSQSTLEGLQQLRAISLHPRLGQPPVSAADDGPFIAASARFKRLFEILDRVHAHREKALIFVELREAQRALYDLIRRRYGLPAPLPETINGATAALVRDRIRHEFQTRYGFDVLILGPKAAGFGLTLTAANHVIHLNRWWNPAVEYQCSDRVYRIGQDKPVIIYLPQAIHPELGDRSFDSLLHKLLEEKRSLSREIVVPVQFGDQDLRNLFEQSLGQGDTRPDISARIDHMDWRGFELWVANELKHAGFSVEVTSGQGDGGVDAIGVPCGGGRPVFVQCKHSGKGAKAQIDESAIRDLTRARQVHSQTYSHPVLAAATNGRFSLATENLALECGVRLFDSMRLHTLGPVLAELSRDSSH
ncbi:MAG: SNF2-related protein [Candidatus Contendobacter sp.]|nr:SNF2-related protein [Candidatus Contendobacter sp.]